LAWVRLIRVATAFNVTACGPASISSSRAAIKAAARLTSGGNLFRSVYGMRPHLQLEWRNLPPVQPVRWLRQEAQPYLLL